MADHNDFSETLESLVTCDICCDILQDPKTLPCLHTLCLKCIQYWNQTLKKNEKLFSCPSCNASINVLGGDVVNFPTSFHHNSLIQLYNIYKSRSGEQQKLYDCAACSNCRFAVGFCIQCEGIICDECYDIHKSMKKWNKNNHQAILWKEMRRKNFDDYIDHTAFCKEPFHEKYRLEYYCQQCKKTVCQNCATTTHTAHIKMSIESKHDLAQDTIRKEKYRIREVAEMHKKELEMCDDNRKRIQTEITEAKIKLRKHFRVMMAILQTRQDSLISKLDETLENKMKDNDKERKQISNALQQAVKLGDHCKSMDNLLLKLVIIEGHEKLIDVCKTTIKADPIISTRPVECNASITYIPNERATKILQNLNVGRVKETLNKTSQNSLQQRMLKTSLSVSVVVFVLLLLLSIVVGCVIRTLSHSYSTFKIKSVSVFPTARAQNPQALAMNSKGFLAVVNKNLQKGCCIVLYNTGGEYFREIGSGYLINSSGAAFLSDDIIVDVDNSKCGTAYLKVFNIAGYMIKTALLENGSKFTGVITTRRNIACLSQKSGKPFIMIFSKETLNHLQKIKLNVPAEIKNLPEYLAFDNNKYFVSFNGIHSVYVFDKNGGLLYTIGKEGDKEGQLASPRGLAVYGADMILVCDSGNHRVQLFNQSGQFISSFGSYGSDLGQMNEPVDVSVVSDDEVFILERSGKRIQTFRLENL